MWTCENPVVVRAQDLVFAESSSSSSSNSAGNRTSALLA